ncbi:MAG: LON peptidase substrate-binding domain-containing protein [Porticoccaceae bacterium]|nr:LON peptidase substrate-binding domain-containing protein [Porticoccaceae bacterium]
MDRQLDLPLFPLGQPLFPGVALPLRIFEQRYLKLVRNALREQSSFAVMPIVRGSEVGEKPDIHPWGTLVTICDWRQQEDGLLGVTVAGERRVRVENIRVQDDGLLRADAEICRPDSQQLVAGEDADLVDLLDKLARRLALRDLVPDQSLTVAALGWRLLTVLPFDNTWRLALLAMDDPQRRLQAIRDHLQALGRR